MKGYRFVTEELTSQHGDVKWAIGEWKKCQGKLSLCGNGFHASQKPIDSLSYVFGSRWFECEARGKILKYTNKFCAAEMRLVKEIPSTILWEFAIDCAWRVLHIFERKYPDDKRPRLALEAAKAYLKSPTEENQERMAAARAAARDAAWDAARDAAWAAARDAAWAAAWAAAWDAAWAAARDAAWAAAWAAAWDAEAAARAAGIATWDAGAATRAAGAAARATGAVTRAAEVAERKWQNRHLLNLIKGRE